jgi:hypothetical protein
LSAQLLGLRELRLQSDVLAAAAAACADSVLDVVCADSVLDSVFDAAAACADSAVGLLD